MREILFRGKRTDNGEWVEGFYVCLFEKEKGFYKPNHYIFDGNIKLGEERYVGHGNYVQEVTICKRKIDEKTVGQYTGLTDKNGNKVFEGDIVEEVYDTHRGSRYEVRMSEERGGWYPFARDDGCGCCSWEVANCDYCEVIGNIHDNPELLKEERDRCLNGT